MEMCFDKLNNTRDLGGIICDGGRKIKSGKLIRSGRLAPGSEEDIRRVAELVSVVVDFRSDNERGEEPDPGMKGVVNLHIPIIDNLAAGVSRDKKSDEEAFMMLSNDPRGALHYMCRTYESFVAAAPARKGYREFVDLLLQDRDKAVLWHCTAGKDRAGLATVIVLEILGADREDIRRNYLKTNELIKPDIVKMVTMFIKMTGNNKRVNEEALWHMFEAREEYLDAAYAKADEIYGGFEEFLRDGLHISVNEIEKLKDMYLE